VEEESIAHCASGDSGDAYPEFVMAAIDTIRDFPEFRDESKKLN
jgi:hypothetical protein